MAVTLILGTARDATKAFRAVVAHLHAPAHDHPLAAGFADLRKRRRALSVARYDRDTRRVKRVFVAIFSPVGARLHATVVAVITL